MQSTICILLIAIAASKCRAEVKIIQGNDISIEFDKPLMITFTNDRTSDVEFRHQQSVVAYCLGTHGCNIDDRRFNITQNTYAGRNEYILTSNDAIQTDLCGVYECNDLLSPEKDSAQVSIKGFNNDTYNATEEKDTIYLTTACIFHVSLSDMQIVWYTYDNTTLRLLDENEMEASMTLFNSASVCSDECGTLSAYKFTFGLNITDGEQGSTDVFIETKIFHPDYMNKPLTWRSSNTFRVKESSPKTPTSGVLMTVIVLVSVCVPVSIAIAIYAVIRFQREKTTNAETPIDKDLLETLISSGSSKTIKHHHRDEEKDSQLESAIDARIRCQENRNINFEVPGRTARREEPFFVLLDCSETIKYNNRDEGKASQLESAIDARIRCQENRNINFEVPGRTARREEPFFVSSDSSETIKHNNRDEGNASQLESAINARIRFQENRNINFEVPGRTARREEPFFFSSDSSETIKHNNRDEGKASQLESAIDARIGYQENRNINFEVPGRTARREEEFLLSSGSSETIKHHHRDEGKDSQLESAIDARIGLQEKRNINFETRGNTARREEEWCPLNDTSERKKHQHRDEWKHSQSESAKDACVRLQEKRRMDLVKRFHTALLGARYMFFPVSSERIKRKRDKGINSQTDPSEGIERQNRDKGKHSQTDDARAALVRTQSKEKVSTSSRHVETQPHKGCHHP